MIATDHEIDFETDRLFRSLMHVDCEPGRQWNYEACRRIAPLTLEINRLKRAKDAVILTHSYVEPEIIYGVGDFKGDSYFLSLKARESQAKMIVFAGVVFMAETAKVLNPSRIVIVPDLEAGCSLVDSCPADQIRAFRQLHPDYTIVSYINTSVEVKAESDILCTSRNAVKIVNSIPAEKPILFLPDINLGNYVKRQTGRENMKIWQGACIVHATFHARRLSAARTSWRGRCPHTTPS